MHFDPLDLLWVLTAAALVLLMQLGFLGIETGFARAKNSINVAIKNTLDFCIATLLFWALGFGLMFGPGENGWIGLGSFFAGGFEAPDAAAFFLFQMVFCGTSATIVSGAVAERTRFLAYLAITVLVSGLIYPVFGHWAWGGTFGANAGGWLQNFGFVDFAGSTVVHSVGAWVALAAVMVIGPRRGAFDSVDPIRGHNLPMAAIGTLVLWFAWWGFNGGSTLRVDSTLPAVLLNTNLAGAAGGLAVLVFSLWRFGLGSVPHILNGIIGGLVAITAGCHVLEPYLAVLVGAVGGLCAASGMGLLRYWKLDDAIGAVAAHGFAGVWGTLAVALGPVQSLPAGGHLAQLGIQSLGALAAFVWTFPVAFGALLLLRRFFPLRVSAEEEEKGLNMVEHGASTDLYELVNSMAAHRASGDFSKRVPVESHTEVGRLAQIYNAVIDTVEREIGARDRARAEALWAQRVAEDASRAKDSFLANMSHEIRTPMNGVIGMLEILRESDPSLTPEQLRYAEVASESAKDLLVILNDILDLTRIQSGKLELEMVSFDLADVVERTIDLHGEAAARKGLELFCWIYDEVPTRVVGDSTRLHQVLSNLLSNAVKFTNEGQITVRVSVAHRRESHVVLDISVDDTGIGISPEAQERLFRPFSQADSSTTRRFGGSGLGLAIARMLVERMEGRIGVVSREDRGSSFWFNVTLGLDPEATSSPLEPWEGGGEVFVAGMRATFLRQVEHILRPVASSLSSGRTLLEIAAWLEHPGDTGSPLPPRLLVVEEALLRSSGDDAWTRVFATARSLHGLVVLGRSTLLGEPLERLPNSPLWEVERLPKPILPRRLRAVVEALRSRLLERDARSQQEDGEASADSGSVAHTRDATVPGEAGEEEASALRILLVEDMRTNRVVAETILRSLGHPVADHAENGEQALVLLQENPFDLVLMDCQMPVIDGYEATRRIRAGSCGEAVSQIPIIAMTAHALDGDREKCLRAGMNDYLSKPLRRKTVQQMLERWSSVPQSSGSSDLEKNGGR